MSERLRLALEQAKDAEIASNRLAESSIERTVVAQISRQATRLIMRRLRKVAAEGLSLILERCDRSGIEKFHAHIRAALTEIATKADDDSKTLEEIINVEK
jgi:hypothetical protein